MPAPLNTLLIDGTFEELSEELAQYIDDLRRKQGDDTTNTRADIAPLLEKGSQDDVLKKLVSSSIALNTAPEKEFIAAYNLLIHLVRQSLDPDKFLARICQNISQPITSSPSHSAGLALAVLTTIFNALPHDNDTRFHILLAILDVIQKTSNFENLRPQLRNIDSWLSIWDVDSDDQRRLYLRIADVAQECGEKRDAYSYLLRALRTLPSSEADAQEARDLSLRALTFALVDPLHFDFQDLTSLDTIQALRKSQPAFYELLEIFSAQQLDEYNDFLEENPGWIEAHSLDGNALSRKIKLLTLASLAASTQSRSIPYQHISRALQVSSSDVEMWVIDVIRAGLVEGKLSQLNQTFLIHRSTYRVFGEKQWAEVASRLDTWRSSLEGVLAVIRQEREKVIKEKERESRDMDGRLATASGSGPNVSGRQARRMDFGLVEGA